jgi:dolichyl-phosphate-mannose--protein O-mannosyl transferase
LLAAIGLYVVFSEMLLRRDSGEKSWALTGLLAQGPISFVTLVPVALATYVTSWLGWINSSGGYSRNWAEDNSLPGIFGALPSWAQSLWNYHEVIYKFHVNLSEDHSYQSHPITWLLGLRPTAFFYETYSFGQMGCESDTCSSAITALGNPLIWVFATAALAYLVYRYLKTRERVIGLVLLGVGALYLPWLLIPERTVFQFYSVSFLPWLILGLVLVMQILYRSLGGTKVAKGLVVGFFVLATLVSVFFLPVNIGLVVPFDEWQLRMWLPSWI